MLETDSPGLKVFGQSKRGNTVVKFPWLISSFLSVCLLSSVAEAASLQSWRFDSSANRLYITTEGGVQPKAQLIFNPTRLVIDLPGVSLDTSDLAQRVSSVGIKEVRIGQFNDDTTRIVIELNRGYTLDPQKVRFKGASPSQWTVDLPTPTPIGQISAPVVNPPTSESTEPTISANIPRLSAPNTVIQGIEVTKAGIQILTKGDRPEISLQQSPAGDIATLDIQGTTVSSQLQTPDAQLKQLGVDRVEIHQLPSDPPKTRVTLRVKDTNINWRSIVNWQGVIIFPASKTARNIDSPPVVVSPRPRMSDTLASIQSINLANNGSQLFIRSDRAIDYQSGYDQGTQAYWVRINQSRLVSQIPQLPPGSPVAIATFQEKGDTVVLWVRPAAGVRIGNVNQVTPQMLALQLQRAGGFPPTPPKVNNPIPEVPPTRNGRVIVVVDPGHGGNDPGAIGIGGIQEKEIVLDISQQVTSLLQQQGIQGILSRTDDTEIDLEPRVALAERVNATLFVSIHANAIDMSRPDVNGIETYYFDKGENLARAIHRSILETTGARDRRVRQARFYVIRKTSMPSVLVEVGFVTGAEDAAKLSDPAYRSQMANAIVRGILQYLRQGY